MQTILLEGAVSVIGRREAISVRQYVDDGSIWGEASVQLIWMNRAGRYGSRPRIYWVRLTSASFPEWYEGALTGERPVSTEVVQRDVPDALRSVMVEIARSVAQMKVAK